MADGAAGRDVADERPLLAVDTDANEGTADLMWLPVAIAWPPTSRTVVLSATFGRKKCER
jgi:hypothetical protein